MEKEVIKSYDVERGEERHDKGRRILKEEEKKEEDREERKKMECVEQYERKGSEMKRDDAEKMK